MNKVKNVVIILLTICYSCKNDNKEKYFPSGNLEYSINDSVSSYYYDTIGNLIRERNFHYKDYDSIIKYYNNGQVYRVGKQDKNQGKFGNWNSYTRDGILSETTEYFLIKNVSVPNRVWYYNRYGDTLAYASKFNRYEQREFFKDTLGARNSTMVDFKIYSKDTIDTEQPFLASVICNSPLGRKYNSQIIMLLAKEDFNFNKNFSNESEVKLDTFYNLTIDKANRINFDISNDPVEGYRYIVAFGRWFKKPGKKILRGYMLEYFYTVDTKTKKNRAERRVYFEKEIYVKGNKSTRKR